MTTNNHPANGPVSLERLHQISEILSKAAAQSDGGNLGYAMADAVKVINGAIAAFGAEPVEFLPDNLDRALTILGVALPISKEEFNLDAERWMQRLINRVIRLESELIPPAPAAPEWTNEQCLEFLSIVFRHAEIKGDLELDDIRLGIKMVNESRSAMLHDAEPVSQHYMLPMQPLVIDVHGTLRFKENSIVRKLLDYSTERGYGLNEMALERFDAEDHMQLAQLIGYSLAGYGELSYVTDESYSRAAAAAPQQEVK
jgi:hypothetical protein